MALALGDPLSALRTLMTIAPECAAGEDISVFHLVAAAGLPGAEDLHIPRCLATLNLWAKRIDQTTERRLPAYHADPRRFENSEAYFRMLVLISVLERELGVRHERQRAESFVEDAEYWKSSRDLLIHGLLGPSRTGTCSSLPVLIVALGRRLRYPLYLVSAPSHNFARWDDGSIRFNIECHGNGISCPPDAYYHQWPIPWPPELHIAEKRRGDGHCCFLRNLRPAEEAAQALGIRARCLEANVRWEEAAEAYAAAARLVPHYPGARMRLAGLRERIAHADACMDSVTRTPGYDPARSVRLHFETRLGPGESEADICFGVTPLPEPAPEDHGHPIQQPLRGIRLALQDLHDHNDPHRARPPAEMPQEYFADTITREGVHA